MEIQIVDFPETKVAVIEHRGSPALEHETLRKLIEWKIQHRLLDPVKHRNYGVHYNDPRTTLPSEYHVDFCLSVEEDVATNPYGIITKIIPACRCARARDVGNRYNNKAVVYLAEEWLPGSGESPGDFPVFFHYVNVGPNVRVEDMITDVYLPLK